MTAFVSPYQIECLPRQAQLYKRSFRSGTAGTGSRVSRFVNRIMFYALKSLRRIPSYGSFSYSIGDSVRSIRFDARNRQLSALYFDAFLPIYEPAPSLTSRTWYSLIRAFHPLDSMCSMTSFPLPPPGCRQSSINTILRSCNRFSIASSSFI